MFGKLRQGSGGTYFINVQQVLQKVTIKKAKLCLDLGIDIDEMHTMAGHSCEKCRYLMNDEDVFNVFHNLATLEESLSKIVKMALVYIAGYVCRNDDVDDSRYYVQEYGDYINELNRGGLSIPGVNMCQWVFYSYALFNHISNSVCRTSLCNVLMMVSEFYSLDKIEKKHGRILSKFFFNN